MISPNAFILVSRYQEDPSWVTEYTDDYIIWNKGDDISEDLKSVSKPNIGGNQRDIFEYIYENYDKLPEHMAFVQGDPFDHCKKEKFDKIIGNTTFTRLESYEDVTHGGWSRLCENKEYVEINNSWYIGAHNASNQQSCVYGSLDEFMNKYFSDYERLDWINFTPGSQYIIEKKQALHYPKEFWYSMMNELHKNNMTEAHIIERALVMILSCKYTAKG